MRWLIADLYAAARRRGIGVWYSCIMKRAAALFSMTAWLRETQQVGCCAQNDREILLRTDTYLLCFVSTAAALFQR
jgi:hypothetical protein